MIGMGFAPQACPTAWEALPKSLANSPCGSHFAERNIDHALANNGWNSLCGGASGKSKLNKRPVK